MNSALIGSKIIRLESVNSTNSYLKRYATSLSNGTLVIADHQTEGYGRQGAKWLDEPGKSLLISFLLDHVSSSLTMSHYHMWPALAIINALESFEVKADLKWPNDVIITGRKVGGILAESITVDGNMKMIIGIGLNLLQKELDFPADLAVRAGSILSQADKKIDKEELLAILIDHLNDAYSNLSQIAPSFVQEKWIEHCCHLNEQLVIVTKNKAIQGVFTGIDESGFALIKDDDGMHRITSFEKVLLREDLCC